MAQLLVTGGCGFIGSNFIRNYLHNNPSDSIVNLDKLTYAGRKENLADVQGKENYSFVKGDICDRNAVQKAMENCSYVINFAAESHVDRSIQDATQFIKTDVEGAYVVLDVAREQGIERFVQISTDEVYGQIQKGSFTETDVLMPRNPYSASKAAADRLAYSFYATYGLDVIITRSSNNFGPFQYPEKVIPVFITNLILGKKVPLYGNGENVRDWLYVLDNCNAIEACLKKGRKGEVYNVGGGTELKNKELTRFILQEFGKGKEMIEHVPDRLGHDVRYSLDCTKIQRELGWTPEHDFKTALRETIAWYKKNETWWKPLLKHAPVKK